MRDAECPLRLMRAGRCRIGSRLAEPWRGAKAAPCLRVELSPRRSAALHPSNATDRRSSSAKRATDHLRLQCKFVCQAAAAREFSYLLQRILAVLRCEGGKANLAERVAARDQVCVFPMPQCR